MRPLRSPFPVLNWVERVGSLQMDLARLLHRRIFSDVKRHTNSTERRKECAKYGIILIFKNKCA